MATLELNQDNFESTIETNDIVLIDFWADWCGPCKSFGPVFEKASEKHTDIVFAKCDTDKEQARIVMDRIQKQYGAFKFGITSLSIGIAEAKPDEENQPLIRRADDALYEAKRAGKNRCVGDWQTAAPCAAAAPAHGRT